MFRLPEQTSHDYRKEVFVDRFRWTVKRKVDPDNSKHIEIGDISVDGKMAVLSNTSNVVIHRFTGHGPGCLVVSKLFFYSRDPIRP